MWMLVQDAADTPFFFQEFVAARRPPSADATVQIRTRRRRRALQRPAQYSKSAAAGDVSPSNAAATLDGIIQRVSAAAQAVLGRPVDQQQPLMEAGLDSLGEQLARLVRCTA